MREWETSAWAAFSQSRSIDRARLTRRRAAVGMANELREDGGRLIASSRSRRCRHEQPKAARWRRKKLATGIGEWIRPMRDLVLSHL